MVRAKICGIRSLEEARWAIDAGADAIGFIFVPQSKRHIQPELAREIFLKLPPFMTRIGVFVNENPTIVADIVRNCHLTAIQLHGNEAPEDYQMIGVPCIKAINISVDHYINSDETPVIPDNQPFFKLQSSLSNWTGMVQGILVDASYQGQIGGTGSPLPWDDPGLQGLFKLIRSFDIPLILAGGLTPENVQRAIRVVKPYAVDVSSGVEQLGVKNQDLITSFIQKVRGNSG
ncbi:N-(5'-phosphoribosyl)anthranilate isomerase [Candidatus Desulfosporosinus infrequens]|uniref:N-(5'-phosphoribosyl)anthranilate isomerase n=1 Tax=Candidatus Desulfosporosinus infrequens TaxID=2043169 RepID=A0A2U3LDV1_9FIRM|nr:N-(5'-phosphoribosyl)anthranilate isomerase [Candidatus Desulfosporosinus infrequens]